MSQNRLLNSKLFCTLLLSWMFQPLPVTSAASKIFSKKNKYFSTFFVPFKLLLPFSCLFFFSFHANFFANFFCRQKCLFGFFKTPFFLNRTAQPTRFAIDNVNNPFKDVVMLNFVMRSWKSQCFLTNLGAIFLLFYNYILSKLDSTTYSLCYWQCEQSILGCCYAQLCDEILEIMPFSYKFSDLFWKLHSFKIGRHNLLILLLT